MVKIYKDEFSQQVVVEGVSPEFPSLLRYSVSNGRVVINSISKNKSIFEGVWSIIADIDGNIFTTKQELEQYLQEVFQYNKNHIKFNTLPILN